MVDILVYIETVVRGRRVFLDFRRNPDGFDLAALSDEARTYLEKSRATQPTPIDRLESMNPGAIRLYRDHGIDIAAEPLQHLNPKNLQHLNPLLLISPKIKRINLQKKHLKYPRKKMLKTKKASLCAVILLVLLPIASVVGCQRQPEPTSPPPSTPPTPM